MMILFACNIPQNGRSVNVGSGEPVPVLFSAALVNRALDRKTGQKVLQIEAKCIKLFSFL